jgi:hypothetical protein
MRSARSVMSSRFPIGVATSESMSNNNQGRSAHTKARLNAVV